MTMGGGYQREATRRQKETLDTDWGYDDGGTYALLAVSGFDIAGEMRGENGTFGIVFSERAKWIRRVRELNREQEAA